MLVHFFSFCLCILCSSFSIASHMHENDTLLNKAQKHLCTLKEYVTVMDLYHSQSWPTMNAVGNAQKTLEKQEGYTLDAFDRHHPCGSDLEISRRQWMEVALTDEQRRLDGLKLLQQEWDDLIHVDTVLPETADQCDRHISAIAYALKHPGAKGYDLALIVDEAEKQIMHLDKISNVYKKYYNNTKGIYDSFLSKYKEDDKKQHKINKENNFINRFFNFFKK